MSAADADAGKYLEEIKAAGLADDTIIFYFADHGPGMPRSKRSPCNSGLQVPLVVFIPERFKDLRPPDYHPGARSDRLVSFVDFAPTVLSLAGVEPPAWMQGHAFLGRFQTPPQPFLFGFRGASDQRIDPVRSATDGASCTYATTCRTRFTVSMWRTCSRRPRREFGRIFTTRGSLTRADAFWKTKPPEELYDLDAAPTKCTTSRRYLNTKRPLRSFARRSSAGHQHGRRGILARGRDPKPLARFYPDEMGHDERQFPFERVFEMAELASRPRANDVVTLTAAVRDRRFCGALLGGARIVDSRRRRRACPPGKSCRLCFTTCLPM